MGGQLKTDNIAWQVRLIAFLLMAGGLLGLGLTGVLCVLGPQVWLVSWPTAQVPTVLYMLLYVCSIWAGLALWRGTPRGFRWAKVLLAAQIPNIRIPGFNYEFQSPGITIRWLMGAAGHGINFHVGPSISIYVSPVVQGAIIGVNVFAIFALIYLMKVTSPDYARSKKHFGLI
jgi:hypothetical protein